MAYSFNLSLYKPTGGGDYSSDIENPAAWITVNGSFASKVQPQQAIAEDFSTYSENAALVGGVWQEYQTNGGAVVKTASLPHRSNAKTAYSDWSRGQFATSYRYYPLRSKKVFLSYWIRLSNNTTEDYGVWKPCRLTSSTRSLASGGGGGGGVYNGVGCFAFSNIRPQDIGSASGQTSFTPVNTSNPSDNGGGTVLGNTPYQSMKVDGWVRVEGFVDLGTANTANGRFYTRVGSQSYNNYTNQTMSSSLRDFYMDTVLLGLDFANPIKWIKINGAVTPNTNYTITYNSVNYTVNSGDSPVLTEVQIIENLYTQLLTVLPSSGNGVFMNAAHTEIRLGDPNSGLAHTFSANLIYRAWGAHISDLYVDYSREAFYLCPTSTFDHNTAEILKYKNWTDGSSVSLSRFGGQMFDGTRHMFYVDANETVTYRGIY